jgi:hypothetical protein
MEQRNRKWDVIFNGLDRGEHSNYFHLICWNYILPTEAVYYEVQMWLNGQWSTKLFYTEKKITSYFSDFQSADRELPSFVQRALYKSVYDSLESALQAVTNDPSHTSLSIQLYSHLDDTMVDTRS